VAEFSGLRASSCVTYAKNASEGSFFDMVASQLAPKVSIIIFCFSTMFFHLTILQHNCIVLHESLIILHLIA
jgi:hypothetical protein